MTSPGAPAPPAGDRTRPALVVAGTLLAVLVATAVILRVGDRQDQDLGALGSNLAGAAAAGACGLGAPDPAYSVDLTTTPDPPRPDGTTFVFTPRHDGKPVTGAKVCLAADMPDMEHPGLTYVTREAPGGRYEAKLQFGMGGRWRMSVIVAEPDKPVVSVPLTVQVAQPGPD